MPALLERVSSSRGRRLCSRVEREELEDARSRNASEAPADRPTPAADPQLHIVRHNRSTTTLGAGPTIARLSFTYTTFCFIG